MLVLWLTPIGELKYKVVSQTLLYYDFLDHIGVFYTFFVEQGRIAIFL